MTSSRIIKRYPNRRLYDTVLSRYITIDEIKELVIKHVDFQVIDQKTQANYTNEILLQIISQQENIEPIFTTHILQNIIRFYGSPMQHTFTQSVERMIDLTKNNMEWWEATVAQVFKKDK